MSYSVDQDETAHNEPSHLDLRCLQKAYYHRLWQWKSWYIWKIFQNRKDYKKYVYLLLNSTSQLHVCKHKNKKTIADSHYLKHW